MPHIKRGHLVSTAVRPYYIQVNTANTAALQMPFLFSIIFCHSTK